ncbi:MAG TPA: oligopeptide transporter, OPT family [Kofleriaceae bacterium]|nr:oligopeptide transporter, OPT family [Kofleriaceae bacterium]
MAESPGSRPQGTIEPYIPASKSLPELTVTVIVLGLVLAAVMAAANAYLGMVAGMTVSASVPAAVISMAVLKMLRTGNILQNNIVQTAAASGASTASGVIFTLPALILIGQWSDIKFGETLLIAGFGGTLGVLFTIPLRRAMIIDQPLQFPEGVATAEVLKVGAEGGGGVVLLLLSGLLSALAKVGSTGLKLWAEIVQAATWLTGGAAPKVAAAGAVTAEAGAATAGAATAAKGGIPFYFGINASPALLSVGYIVGFNVAAVIFAGSVMNRWIAVPLFSAFGDPTSIVVDPGNGTTLAHVLGGQDALAAAGSIHRSVTRYLGVGGMLIGGLWSLFKLRSSLLGGVRAGLDAYKRAKAGGADAVPRTERDMPMNIILALIGFSIVPLFFLFWKFTASPGIGAAMAVLMVVAGFLFSAVSSYMAGLVGSSNNPISGITISTILVAAGLLLLLGLGPEAGPPAAILIGGVVCCAAAIGGDNLQDLKCGQLVGSTPWKQQTMQIIGVLVAALAIAPVLNLLHEAYKIGGEGSPLQVPQATLMGTVSKGVFAGGLPWDIIGVGAAIAAIVISIDVILQKRGSKIRVPVMAFAVGVYLPFELNVPIFLGGIVAWLISRSLDRVNASPERRSEVERNGFLVAAGFITGESLMGIAIAVPVAIQESEYALAPFGKDFETLKLPGLILVGIVFALLYRWSLRTAPKR